DVAGPMLLEQGDKLMLCSDGLWGSVPDTDIVQHLSSATVSVAVPDLVEKALRNGGEHSDNVTVVAFEWETPDVFESTRGISTDSISEGVFASTIQAAGLDPLAEDLDDDAIERSIAEINEAIRRSAAKKA
ncbi:MAG: serine/threonine-protein phosphatase, partial [Burkholderiales bacterium]|nr:serine/threonine-protein phosphatase [Burkholderiales bacterium]